MTERPKRWTIYKWSGHWDDVIDGPDTGSDDGVVVGIEVVPAATVAGTDPWEEPSAKRWIQLVLSDMVPKLADSAFVCSIVPGDREGDVKFWVELGASIMLDKPIVAVAFGDADIPDKLRAVADEIVVLPHGIDPATSDELAAAFRRVQGDDADGPNAR